jgi:CDP-4-dehydro-6-deoxyglucose reductase
MRLTLLPEGQTVPLLPGRTVLDSALAAGVPLPHSCRGGQCGSCSGRLVEGRIEPVPDSLALPRSEIEAGAVLLCRARPLSDLVVEIRTQQRADEVEIRRLPARIERLETLAPSVVGLWLRLPVIEPFVFQAGQYLDVLLDDGARRSYSIASPPHDARPLALEIRRRPGGVLSDAWLSRARVGGLVRIEGPFGRFVYRPREAGCRVPLVLVAGGTGFAPLRALMRHVLETGIGRPLHLYWAVRDAADAYARAWLSTLEVTSELTVTIVPSGSASITDLVRERLARCDDADVYAAGPTRLMEALWQGLAADGWPAEKFHAEPFVY